MKVTNNYLNKYATDKGGWTRYQLESIGVSWPPPKDWKKKLNGSKLTSSQQREFERGRLITSKEYSKEKNNLPKCKFLEVTPMKSASIIKDPLSEAVSLGLWLIKEKNYSLKNAINIASEKRGYKVKSHIEKAIKAKLPEEFLKKRVSQQASNVMKKSSNMGGEYFVQRQHMKSILSE